MFLFFSFITISNISFKLYIFGPHKSYCLLKLFESFMDLIIKSDNSSTKIGANLESWHAKGKKYGTKSNKLLLVYLIEIQLIYLLKKYNYKIHLLNLL